jgi:hypothetical protein
MDFNERLMDFSNAGKPFRPDSTNLNTNKYGGETDKGFKIKSTTRE